MGTRADFYVGRTTEAEWLGSIGWDGYPGGIPPSLLAANDEAIYRQAVAAFLESRDDATQPEQGWPWPWEDSGTTDYAYAYDEGRVWGSCFGEAWFAADEPEPDDHDEAEGPRPTFPDMTARKNVAWDERSGLTFISVPKGEK